MAESGSNPAPGERQARSSRRPPGPGIGARAAATVGSLIDYADARLRLFGLEAREARGAVIRRAAAAAAGVFFLVTGYLAALAGGIALLSESLGRPWHHVALAVGGGHLLLGWFCLIFARRRFRSGPFRDTRRELDKDREWLNSLRPPPE